MKLSAPIYVHWEITSRCNLDCKHCYQDHSKGMTDVDTQALFQIAKKLIEEKVFQVTLTGGEPFLVPEVLELAVYLSENNIIPRITTNGYFVNQNTVNILRNNNVKMQISLDSADEKEHNFIRNNDLAYKRAIEAIKLLVENECDISIGFCANKLNYHHMEDVICLALKLGVKSILIGEIVPNNKKNNKLFFSQDEYFMFINEVSRLKSTYNNEIQLNIDTEWGFLLCKDMEHAPCSALDRDMTILPNGDVVPCPFIRHNNYVIGNICKESMSTIWNSLNADNFRKNKYMGCDNKCGYYEICRSGCKAMLANGGKMIEEADPNAPCFRWKLL